MSTRSPRPLKRIRPQQPRPTRLLRQHTSVHTLPVSHVHTSPHFTSLHLTSPHLTSPHLTSPHSLTHLTATATVKATATATGSHPGKRTGAGSRRPQPQRATGFHPGKRTAAGSWRLSPYGFYLPDRNPLRQSLIREKRKKEEKTPREYFTPSHPTPAAPPPPETAHNIDYLFKKCHKKSCSN